MSSPAQNGTDLETANSASSPADRPPIKGYPMLADQMGDMPEMAAFRSFTHLHTKNLLGLQFELTALDQRLRDQEEKDSKAPENSLRSRYHRNWAFLSQSIPEDEDDETTNQGSSESSQAEEVNENRNGPRGEREAVHDAGDIEDRSEGDEEDREQLRLFRKMQKKLKQYSRAMIEARTIASFSKPSDYDAREIQKFLEHPEYMDLALTGRDRFIWGSIVRPQNKPNKDLVVLRGRPNEDPFSTWVADSLVPLLYRIRFRRERDRTYKDRELLHKTQLMTAAIASLLPVASIVVLCSVSSTRARLGIIAVFNFALSLCICRLTAATRSEIFAVTAAFAAVQVVFVGTNGSGAIESA